MRTVRGGPNCADAQSDCSNMRRDGGASNSASYGGDVCGGSIVPVLVHSLLRDQLEQMQYHLQ